MPGQVSKTPGGLKCLVGEICDTVAEFIPFCLVREGWGEERIWMGLLVALEGTVLIKGDTRRRGPSSVFFGAAATPGQAAIMFDFYDELASRTGFPGKNRSGYCRRGRYSPVTCRDIACVVRGREQWPRVRAVSIKAHEVLI